MNQPLSKQNIHHSPHSNQDSQGASLRAILIGAALIPINLLWITHVEYVKYSDNVSTSALFFNCISLLLFLTLANIGIKRVFPKWCFSRGEMLTVYVMLVVSTCLGGHDQLQILFSTIHYAVARAAEHGWTDTVLPNIPSHLVPSAGEAITNLYKGGSSLYEPANYLVWIKPIAWWTAFAACVVWVMMCLSSIFRKQWEAERLTYPIAEIPLQITDPKVQILNSRIFWLAFAIAASIRIIVVLHNMYPSIPGLPINVRYFYLSTSMPLLAAGPIPVSFFPFALGLCFFLPVQISFSIWFFYVLSRIELITAAAFGHTTWGGFPYVGEQGVGSAIGLSLAVVWYARRHLKSVAMHAMGRNKIDDRNEPMPYNIAFWGFVFGCLFLIIFAVYAGMRLSTAIIYMALFILLVIMVARLRAEVGLPTIDFYQNGPEYILRTIGGDSHWTRSELSVMTMLFWLTRTHRQFPMSQQVDALRIGDKAGINLRSLTIAIMVASVVSIIAAFWAYLHVMYQIGYGSAKYFQMVLWSFGYDPWSRMHSIIVAPQYPNFGRVGAYIFGLLFTIFLSIMRVQFPWWPFHPAGYLAASSLGLSRLMVPLFIAWLAKALILRYSGLKGYRLAIPFFIGLILGEFTVGMVATLIGLCGVYFPPESGIGGL